MRHKGEKRRFSWAFAVSVAIHVGLGLFIVKLALDRALPQGEVVDYDINYQMPRGDEQKTTEIDVVEKEKIPVVAKSEPKPKRPKTVPPPQPPLPPPEVSKSDIVDQAGDVPTEIEKTEEVVPETVPEPTPEINPEDSTQEEAPIETSAPSAPSAEQVAPVELPGQNAAQIAAYGTPTGAVMPASAAKPMAGNPKPTYPYWSRLRRQEGTVVLYVNISSAGLVKDVAVAKSSGFPFLDNEAVKTYRKWKYFPGIEGLYEQPVIFRLTQPATTAPGQLRRSN